MVGVFVKRGAEGRSHPPESLVGFFSFWWLSVILPSAYFSHLRLMPAAELPEGCRFYARLSLEGCTRGGIAMCPSFDAAAELVFLHQLRSKLRFLIAMSRRLVPPAPPALVTCLTVVILSGKYSLNAYNASSRVYLIFW